MIFNQIKKIKKQEYEKLEKLKMKVDKTYKEIKDKKYQERLIIKIKNSEWKSKRNYKKI